MLPILMDSQEFGLQLLRLQQLLGSSIFGASVTEAIVVLLDAMLMMRGVMAWRLLSQLKAGFCLLPLRYICETTNHLVLQRSSILPLIWYTFVPTML